MASPPRAHYDSPWKIALSHAFRAFMAFCFADLNGLIDWRARPRFLDKELADVDVGDQLDGVLADMLVEVRLLDGSKSWILVHVEVQSQRQQSLPWRVLKYNFRIHQKYQRPVASLVVLADEDPSWRPHEAYTRALGTVMGISFPIAKLLDYAGKTSELAASDNPFALLALAHLETQRHRHDPADLYAAKWRLTKLLFQHGWSKTRIIILFKVINCMMALPAPEQIRYRRAARRLGKEQNVEWIDPYDLMLIEKAQQKGLRQGVKQGLQQGMEKGREEGREEGRQKGAAELLARQLTERFGPLPQTVQKKLDKASMEQLSAWSSALLQAQTLKQVFA